MICVGVHVSKMLPTKKCLKCGHEWIPRTVSPSKCPRCQAPFKEGIMQLPVPTDFGAEDRRAEVERTFDPIMTKDLAKLSDEEYMRVRKLHIERAGEQLDHKRESAILKRKDNVLEKVGRIQSRLLFRLATPAGSKLRLTDLEWKIRNLTSSRKVEEVKELWLDLLTFCKTYDFDALISNFEKQYAKRSKTLSHPSPSMEEFMRKVKEDKETLQEAIPILEEGITFIDTRISVLKEAEEKAIPLVEQEHEIATQGHKLMDKIKPLIEPFKRSYRVEEEENEAKLIKKLQPLIKDFRKLEKRNSEVCEKINALQVDVRLHGFPTLILPERLKDKGWEIT